MRIVPRLRREAGSEADSDRNRDRHRDRNGNRYRNGDRDSYRHSNTGRLGLDNRRYYWATIGPRHDRALWHV